jgi:hypothetical protein
MLRNFPGTYSREVVTNCFSGGWSKQSDTLLTAGLATTKDHRSNPDVNGMPGWEDVVRGPPWGGSTLSILTGA